MMSKHAKPATKAERERFRLIYAHGCICCRLMVGHKVECQINHHLSGGKRIGHAASTGECPWHHVGEPPTGITATEAYRDLGPSRKLHGREFHACFGSDAELLIRQNVAIGCLPAAAERPRKSLTSSKVIPRGEAR